MATNFDLVQTGEQVQQYLNSVPEMSERTKDTTIINVNAMSDSEEAYTLETAIVALLAYEEENDVTYQKSGLVLTYKTDDDTWESKQFLGDVSDFEDESLWTDFGSGKVKTVSVNGGSAVQPDEHGNIDVEVPTDLKDLNDDSTHRTVTDEEKGAWNGKQDAITSVISDNELVFQTTDGQSVKGKVGITLGADGIVLLTLTDENGNVFSSMLPGLKIENNILKYSDSVGTWHDGVTISTLAIKGVYSTDPSTGTWALGDLILVGTTNDYVLKVYDGDGTWQSVGIINNVSLDASDITYTDKDKMLTDELERMRELSGLASRFKAKKISIIGDSMSAYAGTLPTGYEPFYPVDDLQNEEQMWYAWVLEAEGATLETNASYSGSRVTNTRTGYPSFADRAELSLLGNPDVIIVALGVNDMRNSIALGNLDYDTAVNSLDESEFSTAYIKGIKKLKAAYPNAEIYCIATQFSAFGNEGAYLYKSAIKNIAEHFGCVYIDTDGGETYTGTNAGHPTPAGMKHMANKVLSFIEDKVSGYEDTSFALDDFVGMGLADGTTFISSNKRVAVKIPADFRQIRINSITGSYSWVLNFMNMPNPNLDMGDMIGQVGTRVLTGSWSQSAPFVIERPDVDFNFAFLMIAKGVPTAGVTDPDISPSEAFENVKFSVVVDSVKVLEDVVGNIDGIVKADCSKTTHDMSGLTQTPWGYTRETNTWSSMGSGYYSKFIPATAGHTYILHPSDSSHRVSMGTFKSVPSQAGTAVLTDDCFNQYADTNYAGALGEDVKIDITEDSYIYVRMDTKRGSTNYVSHYDDILSQKDFTDEPIPGAITKDGKEVAPLTLSSSVKHGDSNVGVVLANHESRIGDAEREIEALSQETGVVDYEDTDLSQVGINQSQTGYTTSTKRVSVKLPNNLSYVEILSCAANYHYALQSLNVTDADAELLAVSGTRVGNSGWLNHSTDVLNKVDSANYSVLTFKRTSGNTDVDITPEQAFANMKFRVHTGGKNMFGDVGYEDVTITPEPTAIDFSMHRCWKVWEQIFKNFGTNNDGLQSCAMYGNYLFQYQNSVHKFRVFTLDGVFVNEFECTDIGHANSIQFGTVVQDGGFPYLYCSGKTQDDDASIYKKIHVLRVTTSSCVVVDEKTITLDENVKNYSDVAFDFKNSTLYVYSTAQRSGQDNDVWLTKYTATNLENSNASTLTLVRKEPLGITLGTQQSVCVFNGMFCVLRSGEENFSRIYFFKCSDLTDIGTYTWPKIVNSEYQSMMPYNYNGRLIIYMTSWFRYVNNGDLYYRLSYIQ